MFKQNKINVFISNLNNTTYLNNIEFRYYFIRDIYEFFQINEAIILINRMSEQKKKLLS